MLRIEKSKWLFVLKGSALNRGMNTGLENLAWGLAPHVNEVHILSGGATPERHSYSLPSNVFYHFTNNQSDYLDHTPLYCELNKEHNFDLVVGWIKFILPLSRLHDKLFNLGQRPKFVSNDGALSRLPKTGFGRQIRALLRAILQKKNLHAAWKRKISLGNNIDQLVAISPAVAKNISAIHDISLSSIEIIPCGVDETIFYPNEQLTNTLNNPPRLIYTGNISKLKGLDIVATAISQIQNPLEFVMFGQDHDFVEQILKYCSTNSPQHRVKYGGILSPTKLADEIRASDMFIFCSLTEGLGKSVLEAMACGVPVIVSDIDALSGFVQNDFNGMLVNGKSPSDIAFAIKRLLLRSDLRQKYSENGRITVFNNYSHTNEVEMWLNLARKISQ